MAETYHGLSVPSFDITTFTAKLAEVDGHTALTLTGAQVSSTVIYNTGQAASDILHNLPTAAYGYSFIATVGTAQGSNYWGFKAADGEYIYLDGTIGSSGGLVKLAAPAVGDYMTFFTFKRASDYAWVCRTGNGVVTAA